MCDTILAPPTSSANRSMLFGKNSDRQRNEAQAVEYFPSARHAADARVTCTYLTIPQVSRTHAVLLCRPFWIWGAEMGANEHGVVIGNEGLHARSPPPQQEALTGMDLLRLALERASSARQALEVIVALLERYGQGGDCGHITPTYYNNGFMVADASEAFVLETVGRDWMAQRVRGIRTMSNRYSIERPDRVSATMPALIRESGWSQDPASSYAEIIADPNREHIGNAGARRACSTALLSARDGRLTALDMMGVLRDHGSGHRYHPQWRVECLSTRTVCMHAGAEDRAGQTVGSMICEVHQQGAIHWVTGTAAPCTSIFKPVLLDVPLPAHGALPSDRFDPDSLWWRHEQLHRAAVLGDFGRFLDEIQVERDALEADFERRVQAVAAAGNVADRSHVIAECWREALDVEERWYSRTAAAPAIDTPHAGEWLKMNRLAGLDPVP